ncbi:MAG: EAL domain-containing protein [Lachnospiraceae bacterium]|nr:EAL domain-containing protein [Lachnospiraceae bacterium]
MRLAYCCLMLFFSIAFSAYTVHFVRHNKDEVSKPLIAAFIGGIIAMLANLANSYGLSKEGTLFAFEVYFISLDFILHSLLYFCIVYTNRRKLFLILTFNVLVAADIISLVANVFTEHCFTIRVLYDNRFVGTYYQIAEKTPYYIHLAICYLMLAASFFILITKAVKVPRFYRIRYMSIVITFTVAILLNVIYMSFALPVDWSVLTYALIGISISYFMTSYVPNNLLMRTMNQVAEIMESGLMVFDNENVLLYINDYANKYFDLGINIKDIKRSNREKLEQMVKDWTEGKNFSELKSFSDNKQFAFENEKRFYKLQFNRIEDKTGAYIGCFFHVVDMTEDAKRREEAFYRATHDSLTGLYTREYFYDQCEHLIKGNPDKNYYMVCSDIANFKIVNELFGEEEGDDILIRFAEMLKEACHDDDVYGRLVGDRFALLIPKERFNEAYFIECIQKLMDNLNLLKDYSFRCYAGVYEITEDIPVSVMCDRALMAVTSIKGDYTKCLEYYDNKMRELVVEGQKLNGELAGALLNKDIKVFIQPQVDTEREIRGGECLVRWEHPVRGMLSPGLFLPIFEKNGRIAEIDKFIWEQACIILNEWKDKENFKDLSLSVNISPRDLYILDVYEIFTNLIKKYSLNPDKLRLEITETAVMTNVEYAGKLIDKLQNFGFSVEMDDFGSGYSSLNTLKDFKMDVLKIDMDFLKMKSEQRGRDILESVIQMADKLNTDVITEGVETDEQFEFLKKIGCKKFQGYLFDKPLPVEKFEERVREGERTS